MKWVNEKGKIGNVMNHQCDYKEEATQERMRERKQVMGETKRGKSIPAPKPVNTQ